MISVNKPERLLNRLIVITDKEIDEKNVDLSGRKLELQNKLDDKKASTLATIDENFKERGRTYN